MTIRDDFDVAIVGAGVAGGALATRLARDGFSVLLLERTLVHLDRIRGEWLAPWGVWEAQQLGLMDELLAAGGHYITKSMRYGDGIPVEIGRAHPIELANLVKGVAGVLSLGHPRLCDTLDQAAIAAGTTLLRGVGGITVEPGLPPAISFDHDGERHTVRPRLVVGADGRGSLVGRQIGVQVQTEPMHHLLAGLLVDGVRGWPDHEQTVTVHNGVNQLVFPQGGGRMRLYLCYATEERERYSGPHAAANFLEAFRVPTLPYGDEIADARISGPCHGYPNADTWIDAPMAPGVVLIGDAAGHNDPTIGQGLSITFRDVRLVAEALSSATEWGGGFFDFYAEERRERMRRLRFGARVASKWRCEFDAAAKRRREEVAERLAKTPAAGMPLLIPFVGAYALPDDAYGEPGVKTLFGDDWSLTADGWFRQAGA